MFLLVRALKIAQELVVLVARTPISLHSRTTLRVLEYWRSRILLLRSRALSDAHLLCRTISSLAAVAFVQALVV